MLMGPFGAMNPLPIPSLLEKLFSHMRPSLAVLGRVGFRDTPPAEIWRDISSREGRALLGAERGHLQRRVSPGGICFLFARVETVWRGRESRKGRKGRMGQKLALIDSACWDLSHAIASLLFALSGGYSMLPRFNLVARELYIPPLGC